MGIKDRRWVSLAQADGVQSGKAYWPRAFGNHSAFVVGNLMVLKVVCATTTPTDLGVVDVSDSSLA